MKGEEEREREIVKVGGFSAASKIAELSKIWRLVEFDRQCDKIK